MHRLPSANTAGSLATNYDQVLILYRFRDPAVIHLNYES